MRTASQDRHSAPLPFYLTFKVSEKIIQMDEGSDGCKFPVEQGPVRAIATDGAGRHMVTAGADGQVKVWDVRKLQPLHAYFSRAPADALTVSQRGLLAVGHGRSVQVCAPRSLPPVKRRI